MPWFKIDDSSYSHPKFRRAGNAALGLWLRCGAYSAQHLLEGRVPGVIAKDFGTTAQVKKLVDVGLWHATGHDCLRCPQPADGDYLMHDFFEGGRNSTRAQVETSRKNAADRQAKARARAAAKAAESDSAAHRGANKPQTKFNRGADKAQTIPNRGSSGSRFQDSSAGQEASSRRDAVNGVTTSHAMPSHTKAGRQEGPLGVVSTVRVPDWCQPLINALARRGISVSWTRLSDMQWAAIQELMNTRGIDTLVNIAASRWNPRDPIKFASLLLTIWLEHAVSTPINQAGSGSPRRPMPPWCGDIDCDETTRLRDAETADGLRVSQPCPNCHPSRKDAAA